MSNTISRGYTFGATELVTNAKLHLLVDSGTASIDTLSGNTVSIGDGIAGNKQISANNGDANLPNLRFNDSTNKWQFSNDGTTWTDMGSGAGGTTYTRGTFGWGSLVSGVCSISHLLSIPFPHTLDVQLNMANASTNRAFFPDEVNYGLNAVSVNIASFLTISNASTSFGYQY